MPYRVQTSNGRGREGRGINECHETAGDVENTTADYFMFVLVLSKVNLYDDIVM